MIRFNTLTTPVQPRHKRAAHRLRKSAEARSWCYYHSASESYADYLRGQLKEQPSLERRISRDIDLTNMSREEQAMEAYERELEQEAEEFARYVPSERLNGEDSYDDIFYREKCWRCDVPVDHCDCNR